MTLEVFKQYVYSVEEDSRTDYYFFKYINKNGKIYSIFLGDITRLNGFYHISINKDANTFILMKTTVPCHLYEKEIISVGEEIGTTAMKEFRCYESNMYLNSEHEGEYFYKYYAEKKLIEKFLKKYSNLIESI